MSDFQSFLDETLSKVEVLPGASEVGDFVTYDIYSEISEMVIKLRDEVGMTQKQLAKKAGLTQANISNIEKGVSRPTVETLKKIADATGKRLVIEFGDQEEVM